jgi:hypothetical protein
MKYQKIKNRYDELENEVLAHLKHEVNSSKYMSKHINDVSIQVNVFDYTELAIINDELTFMDNNGNHYDLYSECSLEDLIDILNKL